MLPHGGAAVRADTAFQTLRGLLPYTDTDTDTDIDLLPGCVRTAGGARTLAAVA